MLLIVTEKLKYYLFVTYSNMDAKEEMLAKNIKEFYEDGERSLKRGSYNSAASLFFKALAVLADWHLLRKEGFIPKSHADRFRLLEQKHREIYLILDRDFPSYQESYSITLTKEVAETLKEDVRKLAKKVGFPLD